MVKRLQAQISGWVHGVGYRYFTVHVAQELGIVGTVRNTADGVEATAEGEESALGQFVTELRKGPHAAQVQDVLTAYSEPTGEFQSFSSIS